MQEEARARERCHICGSLRDPQNLSVEEHKTTLPGSNTKVLERVLYCHDKAECVSAAPSFSFVNTPVRALSARRQTPLGETTGTRPQTEMHEEYTSDGKLIKSADTSR